MILTIPKTVTRIGKEFHFSSPDNDKVSVCGLEMPSRISPFTNTRLVSEASPNEMCKACMGPVRAIEEEPNQPKQAEEATIELTEVHISLLRNMRVHGDMESTLSFNLRRPYGNSDYLTDIAELLDIPYMLAGKWSDSDFARLITIHRQMATAVQILLQNGKIQTGTYVKNDFGEYLLSK